MADRHKWGRGRIAEEPLADNLKPPTSAAANGSMILMSAHDSGAFPAASGLLDLIDQCVMCGLCLPHCPTYRIAATEAESPRGRIALARALATGTLAPAAPSLLHLDQCLGCLSCQSVCPSQVNYEEILVRTRAGLAARRARPERLRRWLRDPRRMTRLARIAAAVRAQRWLPILARVLPRESLWRRAAATLPRVPRISGLGAVAAAPAQRGRVALFRGCIARVYDRDTLAAARRLLTALGHEIVEMPAARCCGALPRHAGALAAARREADATRQALRAAATPVVVTCASGCHADLATLAAGENPQVVDIHAFLESDAGLAGLRFRALSRRVALHLPCTQVDNVGTIAAIRGLLARIPGLVVLDLPTQPRCCGAAGSYFIEHPAIADRLREDKLAQADALGPDLLLTTNVGCRIHFDNGRHGRPRPLPVLHPLVLLAQQLDNPLS